jgi:hypothetical protein
VGDARSRILGSLLHLGDRLGGGRASRTTGVRHRDDRRTDVDGLTLRHEKLTNDAFERRRQLDERFRGLDLDDHLVDRHGVTRADLPGDDLGLGEALADVGEEEFRIAHAATSFSRPVGQ